MQQIKLSNKSFKCRTCSTHLSDPSLMSLSRAAAAGECDFCKSSCCIFSSAALCSVYTLYIVVGLVLHILPNAKHGVHSSSRHCSTTDNRNKKARVGRISPQSSPSFLSIFFSFLHFQARKKIDLASEKTTNAKKSMHGMCGGGVLSSCSCLFLQLWFCLVLVTQRQQCQL